MTVVFYNYTEIHACIIILIQKYMHDVANYLWFQVKTIFTDTLFELGKI